MGLCNAGGIKLHATCMVKAHAANQASHFIVGMMVTVMANMVMVMVKVKVSFG
jgi:hypothetical protein